MTVCLVNSHFGAVMAVTSQTVPVFTLWLAARQLICQTYLVPVLVFRFNPIAVLGQHFSLVAYHPPGRIAERSVDTLNLA